VIHIFEMGSNKRAAHYGLYERLFEP